jgi:hypothetical protein
MSKHTVIVWSESCSIDVCRKHKTVWVASGDYKGATITVQVQTEEAAIKRWREAAQSVASRKARLTAGLSVWPWNRAHFFSGFTETAIFDSADSDRASRTPGRRNRPGPPLPWRDRVGLRDRRSADRDTSKCSVRQVNMTISLSFLAPDLVRAAVEGRLPRGIGVERLRDAPAEWSQQFEALGLNPR